MRTKAKRGVIRHSERFLFDLEPFINANAPMEPSRAKIVFEYFTDRLSRGEEIDERVSRFVVKAFARSLISGSYEKELGVKRKRAGNPGEHTLKRRLTPSSTDVLYARFEEFDAKKHKRGEWTKLCDQLASEFGVSKRTIEGFRTKFKSR